MSAKRGSEVGSLGPGRAGRAGSVVRASLRADNGATLNWARVALREGESTVFIGVTKKKKRERWRRAVSERCEKLRKESRKEEKDAVCCPATAGHVDHKALVGSTHAPEAVVDSSSA